MEDFAFKIQLGLILPKIRDGIGPGLTEITEELVKIVEAGMGDDEKVDVAMVKEVMMKDLEIFLDRNVLAAIESRVNPPAPETESPAEPASEDEGNADAE